MDTIGMDSYSQGWYKLRSLGFALCAALREGNDHRYEWFPENVTPEEIENARFTSQEQAMNYALRMLVSCPMREEN